MRIGLYEYVTAELADSEHVPTSLRREGRAMRSVVEADFSLVPGVEVRTFALAPPGPELLEQFQTFAQQVDYCLVIAPEFDDILFTRCRWVAEAGGRLLGPSPEAVRLTADKLLLGRHLVECGIPTPPCAMYSANARRARDWPTVVVKPRWGAGSQATYRITLPRESARYAALPEEPDWCGEAIVQPFLTGQPASVVFLIGPHQVLPLRPAAQAISTDGRLRYLGGNVPLSEDWAQRAVALASRAIQTVPGILGYVGVDLMLGDDPSGKEDAVLEINPRLTTSYVGLRALARTNLAEAMLRIATGANDVTVEWHSGTVQFLADGTVAVRH